MTVAVPTSGNETDEEEEVKVDNSTPVGRTIIELLGDEEDLRLALMNMEIRTRADAYDRRDSCPDRELPHESTQPSEMEIDDDWDWALSNYDVENTMPQTIQYEVQRLKTLQRYHIVGGDREEAFDRLTKVAGRIFDVPMTVCTLIDLGRQWFVSSHGLGEGRQGPRKKAFCSHTIMGKGDLLQVPDTTKDFRFKDSEYVLGAPFVRFYAGAALMTPEGYKLGTFCVIDTKPWPNGLSEDQQQTLKDFAAMAMKTITDRAQLKERVQKDLSATIASTANDLLTPLAGVRASLEMLRSEAPKLASHFQDCIATACAGTDVMQKICETTVVELEDEYKEREQGIPTKQKTEAKVIEAVDKSGDSMQQDVPGEEELIETSTPKEDTKSKESSRSIVVDVKDCVKRLHRIIDPIPKRVPLVISIDPQVPLRILSDDLKILRASLNILANSCAKTKHGKIHFRIFKRGDQLVFECQDTRRRKNADGDEYSDDDDEEEEEEVACFLGSCGKNTKSSIARHTDMSDLAFNSLQGQVESLNGHYGFRSSNGKACNPAANDGRSKGTYFWFSIPIEEPPAPRPQADMAPSPHPFHFAHNFIATSIYPLQPPALRDRVDSSGSGLDVNGFDKQKSLAATTTANSTTATATIPEKRKMSALVIEDSIVVRKALARALTKQGFDDVVTAEDGVEGLEQLKSRVFDITLIDFLMPGKDGVSCVSEYRHWELEHRPQFSQHIIGISAHASPNDIARGLQVGMNGYKAKPITTNIVKELCNSSDARRCRNFLDKTPIRNKQYCFAELSSALASPTRRRPPTTRAWDAMELECSSNSDCSTTGAGHGAGKRLKLTDTAYRCMPNVEVGS